MDEWHILTGCGVCMGLRSPHCPVAELPREVSDGWASAQPPHASVGYSLGGPPPFSCPYTVGRQVVDPQWLSPTRPDPSRADDSPTVRAEQVRGAAQTGRTLRRQRRSTLRRPGRADGRCRHTGRFRCGTCVPPARTARRDDMGLPDHRQLTNGGGHRSEHHVASGDARGPGAGAVQRRPDQLRGRLAGCPGCCPQCLVSRQQTRVQAEDVGGVSAGSAGRRTVTAPRSSAPSTSWAR
jgi:hypothetical protein